MTPLARTALAAILAFTASIPSHAFLINISYPPIDVVEYYNVYLKHYFLTADIKEMDALENGAAGPGWNRTGWVFLAYAPGQQPSNFSTGGCYGAGGSCGKMVSRFHGTPGLGPNSHFYTGDAAESAALEQPNSGWTFEREAFQVELPDRSDGTGQCGPGLTAVYRLYNNRWMYNDSNHRYVTDAGERARMQAQGWVDEGVHFCAYGAGFGPIRSYEVATALPGKVLPAAACAASIRDACVAVSNLPAPSTKYAFPSTPPDTTAFFNLTGTHSSYVFVVDPAAPASSGFVQLDGLVHGGASLFGIRLDSSKRGAGDVSAVSPTYAFSTHVQSGLDARFFAWAGYESPTELRVSYALNVKTLHTSGPDSAAYGDATLEFVDTKSGRSLVFKAAAYQSSPIVPGDSVGVDAATGKVTVRSTLRAGSPYFRTYGGATLFTPSGFTAPNPWGYGDDFAFRMNRDEFQRMVDDARAADGALSASPDDYIVADVRFDNAVYKDGDVGLNLADYKLEVWKR